MIVEGLTGLYIAVYKLAEAVEKIAVSYAILAQNSSAQLELSARSIAVQEAMARDSNALRAQVDVMRKETSGE